MKNILSFIFILAVFASCSKKTTEMAAKPVEEAMTEAMPKDVQAFRKSAPGAGEARKIQLGKTETFELDNGLTVIVSENHKIPRISYQLSLKNEPILEGDQAGYVSIAGDMLSKGTTNRTKAQIDEEIDFIGANLSTFSSGFFAGSLTKHTDKLLALATDVLYNPTFPEEEFDKIKKQTLSGLAAGKTDPGSMMANVAAAVNYGKDHPYGEVQTEETTNNIKLESVKSYYDNFFAPNNAYLTIVGDIDLATAKTIANKYFGKWQKKTVKQIKNNTVSGPSQTKVAFVPKEGAVQSVIRVTYPIDLKPGEPDVVKASVMNTILGGGFSSRLMQNLREDKAFTYGSRSSLSSDRIVGSFNANASVRNEVTDSSVTEILYELRRISTSPVEAKELAGIKSYMAGGFARSLESPQTIARFALNTIRYNLPADYYDTYLQRLSAVSIEDVSMMAKKYIKPDNAHIVIVGNKDETADKLAQFSADQKVDFFDNEGNIIEYKASAVPSDMTGAMVVKDYLAAIGGVDKINALKSAEVKMSTEAMGQAINIDTKIKEGKLSLVVGNEMMTFQEQKFDGTRVMTSQMGQKQIIDEGPMVEAMREQTKIVGQIEYLNDGFKMDLKGIEAVDGKDTYKVIVETPSGKKSTEYYDVGSSLLVKVISTQDGGPQGSITVTQILSDYRDVDGIMFPYSQKVDGAGPVTMDMKVTSVKFNTEISDDVFKIEE